MGRALGLAGSASALDSGELAPLVRAAAGGDAGAFGRLVDASRNAVTAITLAISRDLAASEDIAQEVYLVVWRRLAELRNPASFLPWVRQIARYTARTWQRDRRTRTRRIQAANDASIDGLLERAADPEPSAEERLLDAERQEIMRAALDDLPDESREVLILFYREGRSSRQVARLLGLSDAAARKRLQRAREALSQDVLERFADLARRSAPGAAFTAAIVAATASAPSAAAAGLAGAASKSLGSKLAALLGGAGLGFLGGAAGVVLGLRRDLRDATDEDERRALRRLRAIALGAVFLASLGFAQPVLHTHWIGPVAIFSALLAVIYVLYLVWLPKLLLRRFLVEEQGDEAAALRRLGKRTRQAWIGFLAGGLSGGAGLVAGLISAGLL